jgi:ribosome-associated heat shock protein Hsp15
LNPERIRADVWLWQARFFRTRGLAQDACETGVVRCHGHRIDKGYALKIGDVLTFAQGSNLRTVRINALGTRRGPPVEAALLYDDLVPIARGVASGDSAC